MEKIGITVNHEICKECGVCEQECPQHKALKGHKHVDHNYEMCDRCLHCYSVCPENAIVLEEKHDSPERLNISPDTLLNHLMYRRSYRRFKNEGLSTEEIDNLLKATKFIPSGGNDHRLNITLVNSDDKRQELLNAIIDYYKGIKKLLKNPFLQVIARQFGDPKVKATLKDPLYFKKILHIIEDIENKDDPVFYHAPAIFVFHTDRIMSTAKEDCILAAYNLVLMSETLKLGSCFVSLSQQAITNDKNCKDILDIPYSHRVDAVVIVGRPKRIYPRPAYRKAKEFQII